MTPILLDKTQLEQSSTVANASMNRGRVCTGTNSYAKELGINPIEFIAERLERSANVSWLDLCCGAGNALIEAAKFFASEERTIYPKLTGIDLVPMFSPCSSQLSLLTLQESSIADWKPSESFDLITCVHGLHYIGDKLEAITRSLQWLKDDGLFLAHLDPENIRFTDGEEAGSQMLSRLRREGVQYDQRKHLISCSGKRELRTVYTFAGANDETEPNYTGQPGVDSYYYR